jgi:hypothetical protein
MGRTCGRVIATLITSGAVAIGAVPSSAGSYVVHACSLPDGTPAPIDGWSFEGVTEWGRSSMTCQQSAASVRAISGWLGWERQGWLAVGAMNESVASWTVSAPASTVIEGYRIYRYENADLPGTIFGNRYRGVQWFDDMHGLTPVGGCSAFHGCTEHGTEALDARFAPDNLVVRDSVALRWLRLSSVCLAADPTRADQCPIGSDRATFEVFASQMRLRDLEPPTSVTPAAGGLFDSSGAIVGERVVRVTATDQGGGLAAATLYVDGRPTAQAHPDTELATCSEPYVAVVPCPLRSSFTVALDSRGLSNGPHQFELRVTDVGGNETAAGSASAVVRNDGAPNGVGATRLATASARFDRASNSTPLRRTVSFNRGAILRGRLADSIGRGISGASLDIAYRIDRAGSGWRAKANATTDATGSWAISVPPGPSREVKVSYRAFALDDAPSAEILGAITVRAGVTLTVKPKRIGRHGRIVFAGRLRGSPGQGGTQVALYAVARTGRARVPVAVLRADSRGRFRYAYRFTRTLAPTTYWFQSALSAQRGYPYAAARSRRVAVRVG